MRAPGTIYHLGQVVADLPLAMRHWADQAGAGPFALFENFAFVTPWYRGRPEGPAVTLAFAYSGDTCIELIQPLSSAPSVYSETPGGLHHIGLYVDSLDAGLRDYGAAGIECAFRAAFPFGGGCAYLDTRATLGMFTELVERNPVVDGLLAQIRAAHRGWNGRDLTFTLS
jgi:methylmalonyl-CoA/ethylmalonyl-CoA epimerase